MLLVADVTLTVLNPFLTIMVSIADCTKPNSAAAASSFPAPARPLTLGMITAAKTPRMAITISNSTSVKPLVELTPVKSLILKFFLIN
jgi:hypothetical protein